MARKRGFYVPKCAECEGQAEFCMYIFQDDSFESLCWPCLIRRVAPAIIQGMTESFEAQEAETV